MFSLGNKGKGQPNINLGLKAPELLWSWMGTQGTTRLPWMERNHPENVSSPFPVPCGNDMRRGKGFEDIWADEKAVPAHGA